MFDRVEWGYLWSAIRRFGFGERHIYMVSLLYSDRVASVCVNGYNSKQFSLFLFNLVAEPLSLLLRKGPKIIGFGVRGGKKIK